MDARKMTKEKYYENAREAITKVAAGFAKKDLHSVNSIVVDIMGEKDQYPEGRGTGQISPEFEGSVITPDYQEKFKNSTGDYGMANNVPRWYGIDPEPVVKSDSRKFNETIGITPEELYKEFTENPATAWSQYLDTKLPEYDAKTNIIIVPEIKEDKEKGIKPKAEESFQLSTTAGAKRFYTVLLSKYPGIGGSKEGLGFKNKFLKLIEEKMGKVQSDATNTTNQLQLDITQGRNFNTGKN